MFKKLISSLPEQPTLSNQSELLSTSPKSRKRLYAVLTLVAVVVIAVAFFIPKSAAAIPLSLNYQVGEKLVYTTTETVTTPVGNITKTGSINSTSSLEVVDFDGEYYTLNKTIDLMLDKPSSISMIEKINKTGYARYFLPGGTAALFGNTSSNPVLASLLSKPDAKVGDIWQIPLNSGSSTIGTTGDLTLTFADIQEITVPAGTYKIFRIDIASNNLNSHVDVSAGRSDTSMSFSGSIYLEYGTCRQIKSDIQIITTTQSTFMNYSISYNSQMTLTQHIKA